MATRCGRCSGTGKEMVTCYKCNGSGKNCRACTEGFRVRICDRCGGTGQR